VLRIFNRDAAEIMPLQIPEKCAFGTWLINTQGAAGVKISFSHRKTPLYDFTLIIIIRRKVIVDSN
jgi:hypothetical protein